MNLSLNGNNPLTKAIEDFLNPEPNLQNAPDQRSNRFPVRCISFLDISNNTTKIFSIKMSPRPRFRQANRKLHFHPPHCLPIFQSFFRVLRNNQHILEPKHILRTITAPCPDIWSVDRGLSQYSFVHFPIFPRCQTKLSLEAGAKIRR